MKVVIIGGSDAGVSAALRARELVPSAQVTMILADRYPNFSICGLPFLLSGEVHDWTALAHRTLPEIEAAGIDVWTSYSAKHIDVARQRLTLLRDGRHAEMDYDRLVIATGARPVLPPIRGIDLSGVHVLHTMDECFGLDERLKVAKVVTIVGGGYIGVEMADALTHRGIEVMLVERLPNILSTVDPEIGTAVQQVLEQHGVRVRTAVTVEAIEEQNAGLLVKGASLSQTADAVLVVVGVRPNSELGATAGAALGTGGALRVNQRMETTLPNVYAAGDCGETWHRFLARNVYMPLGTTAHKQGRVAGANAVGGDMVFQGVVGTQAVKIFDRVAAGTGLTADRARQEGHAVSVVDVTLPDHKAYYPGAKELRVRIIGDRETGVLLGGQLLGSWGSEVAKRIDTLAAAVFHRMKVAELLDLDLSYTPPVSSPWDPLQMAAQRWTSTWEAERSSPLEIVPS